MSRFYVVLVALLLLSQGMFSQKHIERGYRTILSSDARVFVGMLASDSLQGREAGEAGGRKAAGYIVSLLEEWGIAPLGDKGYLQPFVVKDCEMNNILAVIPGKSSEYVVVGAHYDHLGMGLAVDGDSCYNGADDNASGVSAVLQIARAVKKMRKVPERGIIFAFWDGEEKGLFGSKYFVQNFPDIKNVKGYMNFDMIGRNNMEHRPQQLKYLYLAKDSVYATWLNDDIKKYSLALDPDFLPSDDLSGGSDQVPFFNAGASIVWYHTDGHLDYHMPSDHAERINWDKMVDITKAAFLCLWKMANTAYN